MGYAAAFVITGLSTLVIILVRNYFVHTHLIMLYLLSIVFVASKYGRGPAILASILSVLGFDFFCIPPHYSFRVDGTEFVITFLIMLLVCLLITVLTSEVHKRAEDAANKERCAEALHKLSHELSITRGTEKLTTVAVRHIRTFFDAMVAVHLPDESGRLWEYAVDDKLNKIEREENTSAINVFKNQSVEGESANSENSGGSLYIPLQATNKIVGVLQVSPRSEERKLSANEKELLQTFANHMALCLEVAHLQEQGQVGDLA